MTNNRIVRSQLSLALGIVLAFTMWGFLNGASLHAAGWHEPAQAQETTTTPATMPDAAGSSVLLSLQNSYRQVAQKVLPVVVEVNVAAGDGVERADVLIIVE